MSAAEQIRRRIEQDLAYLRTIIDEPVSIQWADHIDIEVRPDNDDDRVLVGRSGWGHTIVNYTSEGLIFDVIPEGEIDSLSTGCIGKDELEVQEDLT
jgi:hypothetical protein